MKTALILLSLMFGPAFAQSTPKAVSYLEDIQPIFDARCVACHSCFSAPCQLSLASYEGYQRGASKSNVFNFPLLKEQPPTRLGIDAHSEIEWQKKGFFSVHKLIPVLIQPNPSKFDDPSFKFNTSEELFCPKPRDKELEDYAEKKPKANMPFGFPDLNQAERDRLNRWLSAGAPGPTAEQLEARGARSHSENSEIISDIENYLNRKGLKEQLVARYIYEHLFFAHLHFEGRNDAFYRLVRSASASGAVQEIATVRPYDPPKKAFNYRFVRLKETMMMKTHTLYALSPKKLEHWKNLFNEKDFQDLKKFPEYGPRASNAFFTFAAIPPEVRYQFLLDNAYYFIGSFIKGPVCRTQSAVNVINDHFWVMFVDPKKDPTVTQSEFRKILPNLMTPPAASESHIVRFKKFRDSYWTAISKKFEWYRQNPSGKWDEKQIWDGDQHNPDAMLTVFRHFNNAQVVRGWRGEIPKTVWVIDYQVLEDIYYNLVAGYDVFGPIIHQLNTRLYMEMSRVSSEDLFLTFLIEKERNALRAFWNRPGTKEKKELDYAFENLLGKYTQEKFASEYSYQGKGVNPEGTLTKESFLKRVYLSRMNEKVRGKPDLYHSGIKSARVPAPFNILPRRNADFIQDLPETILIHVKDRPQQPVYTLIHNREHFNVAMIMFEDERRDPQNDSLAVYPGVAAAFPNLYVSLKEKDLATFFKELKDAKGPQVAKVLIKYSIVRSDERFWKVHDAIHTRFSETEELEFGHLDLSHYENL